MFYLVQVRQKQQSPEPLYLRFTLFPFSSSHLCLFICLPPVITFFFFPSSMTSFIFSFSQFQAKTFLLIRESAEWNHRGVCSPFTLFMFLLPPYALLHSGNEGVVIVCMCVAYTGVFVCTTSLNYSDVVERTWQSSTESPDVNQEKGL